MALAGSKPAKEKRVKYCVSGGVTAKRVTTATVHSPTTTEPTKRIVYLVRADSVSRQCHEIIWADGVST